MSRQNRYSQLIETIFFTYYQDGTNEITFEREEFVRTAQILGINLPKNLGDVIYSFRYRTSMPARILETAPQGLNWIIRPAGRALYKFVLVPNTPLVPNAMLAETKIPDATPGIVAMYALNDEQALLTKMRYNRLIDIFCSVTCYSIQNHLRTTIPEIGQVETDEIYVGVDKRGAHYVFPVQAKGGTDRLNVVQIEQDFALCAYRFPDLICRAIGAQFMQGDLIALFEFEMSDDGVRIAAEKHYKLVLLDELSEEELRTYKNRPADS
jgi:hypothetical protein